MKKTIFAFLAVLSLVSCKKDKEVVADYSGDTTLPKIELTAPLDLSSSMCGSDIYVSGTFTDETALKECVVSVVKISDLKSSNLKTLDVAWAPLNDTIKLSGTKMVLTDYSVFTVPYNASLGNYKLTFTVADMNKNKTVQVINFEIPY